MSIRNRILTERGTRTWSVTVFWRLPVRLGLRTELATLADGMAGLDWRSGVGHESPVAVTVASIGSASPKTHLYFAPSGKSGSVLMVNWTWAKDKDIRSTDICLSVPACACYCVAAVTTAETTRAPTLVADVPYWRVLMARAQYTTALPNYVHYKVLRQGDVGTDFLALLLSLSPPPTGYSEGKPNKT